jgi:hypothetical protein
MTKAWEMTVEEIEDEAMIAGSSAFDEAHDPDAAAAECIDRLKARLREALQWRDLALPVVEAACTCTSTPMMDGESLRDEWLDADAELLVEDGAGYLRMTAGRVLDASGLHVTCDEIMQDVIAGLRALVSR